MRAVLPVLGEPMTTTLCTCTSGALVSDSLDCPDDSPEDPLASLCVRGRVSHCWKDPAVDLNNFRRREASLITSKSLSVGLQ
jgi:hypothetical protein